MPGVKPRLVWTAPILPRLLPDERILFSKEGIWYFSYRLPPWQFGDSLPIPFLINIFFYITSQRALTVVRHCKTLDMELSQWRVLTPKSQATEVISKVTVGKKHFGNVRFDFFGLGKGQFGMGSTPFDKQGGEVPYLEIASEIREGSRFRTAQIYFGVGIEAEEDLDTASKLLLEKV